jgi:polysaccharide pyruvyl transferase WcaK-like protein
MERIAVFSRKNGQDVVLLALQPEVDRPFFDSMEGSFAGIPHEIVDVTVENHRDVFGRLDLLIATRLHAVLLGFLAALPTFALVYDEKIEQLLDEGDDLGPHPHRHHLGREPIDALSERFAAWLSDPAAARFAAASRGQWLLGRAEKAKARVEASLDLPL